MLDAPDQALSRENRWAKKVDKLPLVPQDAPDVEKLLQKLHLTNVSLVACKVWDGRVCDVWKDHFKERITEAEAFAILAFTVEAEPSLYRALGNAMTDKDQAPAPPEFQQIENLIRSGLGQLDEEVFDLAYRGFRVESSEGELADAMKGLTWTEGSEIELVRFSSFSTSHATANNFSRLSSAAPGIVLKVIRGTFRRVGQLSAMPEEQELMEPPPNKYRVIGRETLPGSNVVVVTAVPVATTTVEELPAKVTGRLSVDDVLKLMANAGLEDVSSSAHDAWLKKRNRFSQGPDMIRDMSVGEDFLLFALTFEGAASLHPLASRALATQNWTRRTQPIVSRLLSTLVKVPAIKVPVAYRGIRVSEDRRNVALDAFDGRAWLEGHDIEVTEVTSFSTVKDQSLRFALGDSETGILLVVEEGSFRSIKQFSAHPQEEEVVPTSRCVYRVMRRDTSDPNLLVIYAKAHGRTVGTTLSKETNSVFGLAETLRELGFRDTVAIAEKNWEASVKAKWKTYAENEFKPLTQEEAFLICVLTASREPGPDCLSSALSKGLLPELKGTRYSELANTLTRALSCMPAVVTSYAYRDLLVDGNHEYEDAFAGRTWGVDTDLTLDGFSTFCSSAAAAERRARGTSTDSTARTIRIVAVGAAFCKISEFSCFGDEGSELLAMPPTTYRIVQRGQISPSCVTVVVNAEK